MGRGRGRGRGQTADYRLRRSRLETIAPYRRQKQRGRSTIDDRRVEKDVWPRVYLYSYSYSTSNLKSKISNLESRLDRRSVAREMLVELEQPIARMETTSKNESAGEKKRGTSSRASWEKKRARKKARRRRRVVTGEWKLESGAANIRLASQPASAFSVALGTLSHTLALIRRPSSVIRHRQLQN
ncbi:hypothetical protein V9T40_010516 [Parthenolecanium corni]|uniref:Uncharacterized protein n=1 Tax=Parthenolecanium corni TaxID=536013 RepID=A0AAN9XYN0_9HEMI